MQEGLAHTEYIYNAHDKTVIYTWIFFLGPSEC